MVHPLYQVPNLLPLHWSEMYIAVKYVFPGFLNLEDKIRQIPI